MQLSVCMIVRDAMSVLPRCLASLEELGAQLCIVDTGSADGTDRYAQSKADRFARIDGCNGPDGLMADFSLARNSSIELAGGRWILAIDADEIFANPRKIDIRAMLNSLDEKAVALTVCRGDARWPAIRLFRNIAEHRYVGAIHELVQPIGPVATRRELAIVDLGQDDKPEPSAERNVRICSAVLAREPEDLRARFYRAEALRKTRRFAEAGRDYSMCLASRSINDAHRCATLQGLAICLIELEAFEEAIEATRIATTIHPGLAELYCLRGDACLALHDMAGAKRSYELASQCPYPPDNYILFVREQSYGSYPAAQLKALEQVCSNHGIDFDSL